MLNSLEFGSAGLAALVESTPMSSEPHLVTVRFEESEIVTAFGTTKVTYRVRVRGVWTNVAKIKSAATRVINASPGVVWQRVVDIRLRVGTEIEKCIEAPASSRRTNTYQALLGVGTRNGPALRHERLIVSADARLVRKGTQQ